MSEMREVEHAIQPDGANPPVDVDISPPTGIMDRVIEGSIGKALSKVNAQTVFGDPVTQGIAPLSRSHAPRSTTVLAPALAVRRMRNPQGLAAEAVGESGQMLSATSN